jgi:tryptophanyl-tRNA synthetase
MGLDDPTKKMSKSETAEAHAICLLDSPETIRSKIMRATTDSQREIRFDEGRPAVHNLLTIYELFTGMDRDEIEKEFTGKGYSLLKQKLAEVIVEKLKPIQSRYEDLMNDPSHVEKLLSEGASRASCIAERVLTTVKARIGLG